MDVGDPAVIAVIVEIIQTLFQQGLDRVRTLRSLIRGSRDSEFIEKAIRFYLSYLSASDDSSLLPNTFLSSMKSIVAESDNRISRLLFKMAVEMAMMMNILAAMDDVDEVTLSRLRGECVKEVKQLNGAFSMEDAVKWQGG